MGRRIKIYTCGKMSGTTFESQMKWRIDFDDSIREALEVHDIDANVVIIHPPLYYNYVDPCYKSQREIFEWEMAQVCDSDIVVVNLDNVGTSVGACMELGAVKGCDKKIFVIGIGDESNLHPWIKESCLRIEDNIDDAADYIVNYLCE